MSKPLILAGHGVRTRGGYTDFQDWIEKVQIPVVTTQLASDLIAWDHPLYVGHPGVKGDRAGNLAVQNCTELLILGCSLHPSTTGYNADQFAPQAKKFFEPFPTGLPVSPEWISQCRRWKETLMVRDEPHDRSQGINYYDVIEALSVVCQGDETLVMDSGMAYYVTGQAFRVKRGQRLIFPGALAQMGYALPGVTGACLAAPHRTVIGITGDGGFQTNIHELGVIAYHKLNAKLLVINNGGYACIRNTQRNYFEKPYCGTDQASGVGFPSTEEVCKAYRIPYITVKSQSELQLLLEWALSTEGPLLVEVFTTVDQEFMPVVKSWRLPTGEMASGRLEQMWPPRDAPKDP